MSYFSVGDMSQLYGLRRHGAGLKATISTLSQEVATGIKSDIGNAVKGDFTQLSAINRGIAVGESFKLTTTEAALSAQRMQSGLEAIQDIAVKFGPSLLSVGSMKDETSIDTVTNTAESHIQAIIGAINSNVAGRHVFSGQATDRPAVVPAAELIAQVEAAISGATSASDILTAVDGYFNAPVGAGGYLDQAYLGSRTPRSDVPIGEGQSVSIKMTAQNEEIREALKGAVLAHVASNKPGTLSLETRAILAQRAGEHLSGVGVSLSASRGGIGAAEELIEAAATRNSAEMSGLKIARNELIVADPYESATALTAAQAQLETIYAMTARLSRMSLVDYL
ncbi:hypothetical protein ERN12_14275 [Rhodobacteraceae bacterium]|nr:hypothetical protein ERN12_14275 [Paracoccaceae bacterium]